MQDVCRIYAINFLVRFSPHLFSAGCKTTCRIDTAYEKDVCNACVFVSCKPHGAQVSKNGAKRRNMNDGSGTLLPLALGCSSRAPDTLLRSPPRGFHSRVIRLLNCQRTNPFPGAS